LAITRTGIGLLIAGILIKALGGSDHAYLGWGIHLAFIGAMILV
jgi:hypothetical protein